MLPAHSLPIVDHPVAAIRHSTLAKRVQASPQILAVIADLAWPPRDGAATTIRIMPAGTEAHAHG